jgi:fructose-1-phosphate kinase PfkB-like protein
MKTLLIIDAGLGQARAYMAKTLLGAAAPKAHLEHWVRSVIPTLLWLTARAATAVARRRVCSLDSRISREGALWVNASGEWIAKPPSVEVVSTVGAGDSMVGGLISLRPGKSLRERSPARAAHGRRR